MWSSLPLEVSPVCDIKWCKSPTLLTDDRFSHDEVQCHERCSRYLGCGHPCVEPCHVAQCKSSCGCVLEESAIEKPFNYAQALNDSLGKKDKAAAAPRPYQAFGLLDGVEYSGDSDPKPRKPAEAGRSFRDFARGGHIKHDQEIAERAAYEAAEARREDLDKVNAAALFGNADVHSEREKTDKMELVRTKPSGRGRSRSVWKGIHEPSPSSSGTPSPEKETSLLDL